MNINGEKFVRIVGKGHAKLLSKQIADCWENEFYSNVKFICKNNPTRDSSEVPQSLVANKFILAAASKKFCNLLADSGDEEVTILVPDENFSTLKLLLQYIYSGEIYLSEPSEELNLLIDEWDIVSPDIVTDVETQRRTHIEAVATSRPKKTAISKKSHLPTNHLFVTKETISGSPSVDKTHDLSQHSSVELIDVTENDDTCVEMDNGGKAPSQIPTPPRPVSVKKNKPRPEENLNGYVFLEAYKKKVGDCLGTKPVPSPAKPKRVRQSKIPKTTPVEQPLSEALVIPVNESNPKPKRKRSRANKVDGPKKPKVTVQTEENDLSENEDISEEDKQDLTLALKYVNDEIQRRKILTEQVQNLANTVNRHKVYVKFFLEPGILKSVEEKVVRIPCSTCGKMIHRDYMAKHVRAIHTTEKPYLCELCGKTFTILHLLSTHMRNYHPDESKIKIHECSVCKKQFKKGHYLKRHMTLHQGLRPHCCPYCDKCFRMRTVLVKHKRTHTGEKPYQCKVCQRCFSARFNYVSHMRTHTARGQEGSQMSSFIDQETQLFKCDVCATTFHRELAFMIHKAGHTSEEPKLPCRHCPETFGTIKNLKNHTKEKHADLLLQCEQCPGKLFKNKASLSNHMLLHTRNKQHVCTVCKKDFHSKIQLETHYECVHLDRRPFACRFCDKRFKQKLTLRGHERIHTDERPFKCIHCPKSFRHDSHLQNHTRLHTGEKPFVCPHCNKAFSNKNNMSIHIKIHTGEKNECSTCNKVFRTMTKLREHEKSHEISPEQELVDESTSDCNEK